MQCFYIFAGVEWVNTICTLAAERKALGMPWIRMVVILGAVAVLTFCSAMVLKTRDQEGNKELPDI